MKYAEVIESLSENIINFFDEVYHSAELITNDKGIKQPVISISDEWISLAPTDQREIIYIRRNGDDEVTGELNIGSCIKSYKMRSSLRVVFFKDHAKNHSKIISDLMQSVLVSGVKLKSILRDKTKLFKDESSGDYSFGGSTAYFAIDLYAIWELSTNLCDQDFCIEIQNPLKRESCPVAA